MSIDILLNEIYDYVVNRNYDIYFCDMVPAIAGNVLQMSVIIIEKCNGSITHTVEPRKSFDDARAKKLFVLKRNKHYDGIVRITNLQYSVRQAGFIMGQDNNSRIECLEQQHCATTHSYGSPKHANTNSACINGHPRSRCAQMEVINIHDTWTGCKNDVTAYEIHRNSRSTNYDTRVNILNDNNVSHIGVEICICNINGLTNKKLHDGVLGKFLKHFDIIVLSETWTRESDNFTMSGYCLLPRQQYCWVDLWLPMTYTEDTQNARCW